MVEKIANQSFTKNKNRGPRFHKKEWKMAILRAWVVPQDYASPRIRLPTVPRRGKHNEKDDKKEKTIHITKKMRESVYGRHPLKELV